MAYNYEYPYTDVHRHNDDWLINRVKELSLEWIETRKEWNNTREEFASLKAFIQNYFAQLDVQDEVNVKLDIMARDGSLSALISPLFSEYKKEIDRTMSEHTGNISLLNARMDAFTALSEGSTTGDAELIDARVDSVGKIHPNVGNHIRAMMPLTNYMYVNEIIARESVFNINIDPYDNSPLFVKIVNNANREGYLSIYGYTSETDKQAFEQKNLHLLETDTIIIIELQKFFNISKLIIQNINEIPDLKVDIYRPFKENVEKAVLSVGKLEKSIFGKEATRKGNGYIGNDGRLNPSDDFEFVEIVGVTKGDTISYTGGYGSWCPLWAYDQNGNASELLPAGNYEDMQITLNNDVFTLRGFGKNNVNLKVLPISQTKEINNTIIVDASGFGDFTTIQSAIVYAKATFDVATTAVTIFIKNGYYKVEPTNSYPYAPINKGANKISLIGETRDGVIIECTNTATTQSKVLDIGGECTIENLTILCLKDATYTSDVDLSHNCYCIHNDTGLGEAEKRYYTTVKNCKLYSECHSPVGAGLHDKQIQRYVDCEFISNGILSAGALYIHASVEDYAKDMGVEIENCTCISKDGKYALTLPNVADSYGSLKYTDIPTTIRRTICVTNGNYVTNVSKDSHALTESSALNNVESCNY